MNLKQSKLKKITSAILSKAYRLLRGYAARREREYWRSLKGKFKGQRGWVIGNGPSLKVADLDKLEGEVCVASNKIYLAFDQTKWRPTFVTIVDKILWRKIEDESLRHYKHVHLPCSLCRLRSVFNRKIRYWHLLPTALKDPKAEVQFSTDTAIGMHGGSSVTYENLQLANYLGLNPIYIIGCDHHYGGESDVVAGQAVVAKKANHFHPDYRKEGELVNPAHIDDMNCAYSHARAYADLSGLKIYNATRGGHLEIFERRDFDDVLAIVEVSKK
jgi:hypothetical protein